MASDIDDILSKITDKEEVETSSAPLDLFGEETDKPIPIKKEEKISTEKLEINPEDVKSFLEMVNNFLEKREDLKKWKLDEIETKNATTLLVRLSEKYGVWLLNYALEIEAGVFLLFYVMARYEIPNQKVIRIEPKPEQLA